MTSPSDVDRILSEIRAEVRIAGAEGVSGRPARGRSGLARVRGLFRSPSGAVRAGRLLRYHDAEFVRRAYLALLNRQPDPEGLLFWLGKLREEKRSRVWVLGMISGSREGRIHGVPIRGLKVRTALHWPMDRLMSGRAPRPGSGREENRTERRP